jgi:hypothetical protein|eukprot:COSAG01_NODE_2144_length_8312_cov_22.048843_2_plen_65_part_00
MPRLLPAQLHTQQWLSPRCSTQRTVGAAPGAALRMPVEQHLQLPPSSHFAWNAPNPSPSHLTSC